MLKISIDQETPYFARKLSLPMNSTKSIIKSNSLMLFLLDCCNKNLSVFT